MDNSEVVCRQLGYNGTVPISYNHYSIGRIVETMDNVVCSGNEYQLSDCYYDVHVAVIDDIPRTDCAYYGCSTGEIRLIGGESEGEGRLEVCNNRRWGSVCGTQWTNRHTAVVCRYLGFSDLPTDLTYYSPEKYGKGSGPVFMDFVNCTGDEWNLWGSCTYWTHYYGCSHDDDIGVQCAPARCSDGQLRLAEGSVAYYGRVEICSDQRWNTLSNAQWSYSNARIACIELGFQYASYAFQSYGNSGGPRHSKYFSCAGSVLRLSQCQSYNYTYTRSYSSDIGVYCHRDNCVNGQIRLIEGEDQLEGRLEVCYNRRWGNVGGDEWTETNSRVVCNSLGYDLSNESTNLSIPTAPSKPLYYHSVKCSRRDLSLEECGFTRYTDLTKTYPHTVVKCRESQCKDGDLKLVGGATESEGRLEVCFGKRWGTIDGHGWTHTDTQVACRQLGHSTEDVSYTKHLRTRSLSSRSLPTFMTLVGCYGSEDQLTDCSYHEFESSSSTISSMDISISCDRKDNGTGTMGSPTDTNDDGTGGSSESSSGMVYASLSVSALLAVVVIALVAVLIVVWLRKKSRGSSSGIHFSNKNETVSLDNKLAGEDLPTESFEQMKATNPVPLPPRSQLRQAPTDNVSTMSPQKVDLSRYAQSGGNSRADAGPKTLPHVLPRRGRQRPPAEEDIYECPD
ncbi:Neurotrypsin [Geodia barretti]|uniref:Neurotrypsin n=1 Tax=Geodia barretti TaxID=519541 RepID=A0AA35WJB7_GEOBA|nr:Neurotrypsin [Geodia barretti]